MSGTTSPVVEPVPEEEVQIKMESGDEDSGFGGGDQDEQDEIPIRRRGEPFLSLNILYTVLVRLTGHM